MKIVFVMFLAFFVIVSCDDSPTDNTSKNIVSASINGNSFRSENINCEVLLGPARKVLRIYGESGELAIELLLRFEPMDSIKTGNYDILQNTRH